MRTVLQLQTGQIYALPMPYLTGAVYTPENGHEKLVLYWASWVITIGGRDLQSLAGELTNGQIERLIEVEPTKAELVEGPMIEIIDVQLAEKPAA